MKKYFNLFIFLICIFILSSCSLFTNTSETVENEVHKTVVYEDITIKDFNNMLETASEKILTSSIAIIADNPSWFSSTESLGSGVIVKKEVYGTSYKYYAVTNRHVVAFNNLVASKVDVYYNSSSKISGSVVGYSLNYDCALITFVSDFDFSAAIISDTDNITVGSICLACGTPYSLQYFNTVTQGIVSCKSRMLSQTIFNSKLTINVPFIQHDASINSGNSGGGLFDIYGNLIGLNTLQYNDTGVQGMNFALPISIVLEFVKTKITL